MATMNDGPSTQGEGYSNTLGQDANPPDAEGEEDRVTYSEDFVGEDSRDPEPNGMVDRSQPIHGVGKVYPSPGSFHAKTRSRYGMTLNCMGWLRGLIELPLTRVELFTSTPLMASCRAVFPSTRCISGLGKTNSQFVIAT